MRQALEQFVSVGYSRYANTDWVQNILFALVILLTVYGTWSYYKKRTHPLVWVGSIILAALILLYLFLRFQVTFKGYL